MKVIVEFRLRCDASEALDVYFSWRFVCCINKVQESAFVDRMYIIEDCRRTKADDAPYIDEKRIQEETEKQLVDEFAVYICKHIILIY